MEEKNSNIVAYKVKSSSTPFSQHTHIVFPSTSQERFVLVGIFAYLFFLQSLIVIIIIIIVR